MEAPQQVSDRDRLRVYITRMTRVLHRLLFHRTLRAPVVAMHVGFDCLHNEHAAHLLLQQLWVWNTGSAFPHDLENTWKWEKKAECPGRSCACPETSFKTPHTHRIHHGVRLFLKRKPVSRSFEETRLIFSFVCLLMKAKLPAALVCSSSSYSVIDVG